MIIGVCDSDPVAAGLIAHYLSVAFDVMSRTKGITAKVGVLEPFTLTDPSQVDSIGEPPAFGTIDVDADVVAFVSLNGFSSPQVERRITEDGVANVSLDTYLNGSSSDDPIEVADACMRVARDLATRFAST